jgi:hypothetical protein
MPDQQPAANDPGEPVPANDASTGTKPDATAAKPANPAPKREVPDDDGRETDKSTLALLLSQSIEFSKSGFFFILLGCGFLYFAYRVLYHVHPTFVFILALLGMSIVLFGTGTQSLGSGEFTEPGSKAKAKFYLAGGAGVLAGLFGFGAVMGSDKIVKVFQDSSGYALVVFEINNPTGIQLPLATVSTSLRSGLKLPMIVRDTSIDVLVPIQRGYSKLDVCIEAKGLDKKWSIEHDCPTLDLTDNVPGQRDEPVQSVGTTKLELKIVSTPGLDEHGKPTLVLDENGRPISVPSFVAN